MTENFLFTRFNIVISIHTLRVEGDLASFSLRPIPKISIHTLRVEGDRPYYTAGDTVTIDFNPHPPRGG